MTVVVLGRCQEWHFLRKSLWKPPAESPGGNSSASRRGGTPRQNDQYERSKCHVSYLQINLSNGYFKKAQSPACRDLHLWQLTLENWELFGTWTLAFPRDIVNAFSCSILLFLFLWFVHIWKQNMLILPCLILKRWSKCQLAGRKRQREHSVLLPAASQKPAGEMSRNWPFHSGLHLSIYLDVYLCRIKD